jgi:hypothetical protein
MIHSAQPLLRFVRKGLEAPNPPHVVCIQLPRRAPDSIATKIPFNGGRAVVAANSAQPLLRFVRKGLEGREAVAPSIKNMHCMFFILGVTEPPQSPVFCVAKNAPKIA